MNEDINEEWLSDKSRFCLRWFEKTETDHSYGEGLLREPRPRVLGGRYCQCGQGSGFFSTGTNRSCSWRIRRWRIPDGAEGPYEQDGKCVGLHRGDGAKH